MNRIYDVVVIGGGIVGASAAYYLSKAGRRVALVEKGRVAGEQSSRNWGSIRVQGRNRAEIPLMLDCIDIWKKLETELGESIDWVQQGQMLVAYDEEHLARLEALIPTAKEFGIPSRILGNKEVHEVLPHYRSQHCLGAMFNPLDGCAEPEKVTPALARAAQRRGAELFESCAVTNIETTNGTVVGVQTENGLLNCEAVVLACGAWTSKLAKSVGITHPSLWIRGSVARTAPLPIEMRKLVVWGSSAYRQRLDGRVNIAVSEDGFHDVMLDSMIHGRKFLALARQNWRLIHFSLGKPFLQSVKGEFSNFTTHRTLNPDPDWRGLDRAKKLFTQEYPEAGDVVLEHAWAGYIDYMPDELPVIDMCSKPAGLVIAAGLSGNGFGIGPVVGKTVSDLIVTGASRYDLNPFSSKRFNQESRISR